MWRISIHHDFDSLGVPFHPVVVICLGKNLLLKSLLGHCGLRIFDWHFQKRDREWTEKNNIQTVKTNLIESQYLWDNSSFQAQGGKARLDQSREGFGLD